MQACRVATRDRFLLHGGRSPGCPAWEDSLERCGGAALFTILACQGMLYIQKISVVLPCVDTSSLWSPLVVLEPDSSLPAPAGVPDSQRAVWVHQWLPP